jgi:DNA-binding transcriptional LysR family regulator
MIDLNTLVILAAVVEAHSFSEGARRLNMPLSTVSRRIYELEDELGVRLIERSTHSTRSLRLTEIGREMYEHAKASVELSSTVSAVVDDQLTTVAGTICLSAPPSISETLLAPVINAFQALHPAVRVHVLVTAQVVDPIVDGIDLMLRMGKLKDSNMVARPLLRFRHQLVASPIYLAQHGHPVAPQDLPQHRVLAFAHWKRDYRWTFYHVNGVETASVAFQPFMAMNDFAGLTPGLLAGAGIGIISPIVQPGLIHDGRLVELMPNWRAETYDLSVVHMGNRHMPRIVRLFRDFICEMAPAMFPDLPA